MQRRTAVHAPRVRVGAALEQLGDGRAQLGRVRTWWKATKGDGRRWQAMDGDGKRLNLELGHELGPTVGIGILRRARPDARTWSE